MYKRKRMSKRRSRKSFTKYAKRVHKRNVHHRSMRGGIRL